MHWAAAQNSIEVKSDSVKITTSSSGKAYYNKKEIATQGPVIDLASTAEQLTGETFNGKPVYAKSFIGDIMSGAGNVAEIYINIPYNNIWIDSANSFATINLPQSIIMPIIPIIPWYNLPGPIDVVSAFVQCGYLEIHNGNSNPASYRIRLKYTK